LSGLKLNIQETVSVCQIFISESDLSTSSVVHKQHKCAK